MKANYSASDQTQQSHQPDRALGALIIIDALLSMAPVVILGAAIGWPTSLGKPAAEQLAAIHAHAGAVTFGYGVYLLYSILIAPVMIGMARRVLGDLSHPIPATVVAFAALSTLARAVGILRWLTVMPALAALHANAPANTAAREHIELVFSAITNYGGSIGEILGVSLFMAISIALLCVGGVAKKSLPAWLSWPGLVTAGLLSALALPTFGGPTIVPVAIAVSVLSTWMLAVGIWCCVTSNPHK